MDPPGTPIPPLQPHLMGVIPPQAVAPAVPSRATNPGLGPQIAPGLPRGSLVSCPRVGAGRRCRWLSLHLGKSRGGHPNRLVFVP